MTASASKAKENLRQCVVQIRSRDDLTTAEWVSSNEDEIDSAQLYIDERLPTGDYAILHTATLRASYATH